MTFQKDPEKNETKYLQKFADIPNKRVLEIGCGEGRLTWRYADRTTSTIGIEPDINALRVARYDRPSDLVEKVTLVNAQGEHLPFRKETFDIALLSWSL
jgi:ubiquinone/menaquinone biosynthesis C-methylase UbiE